ncbi:hypothetical protein HS041_12905 [Planomonospora sp. ID67723]|uniref:hypothetical protein n=1 Tax=Planomonospora sp. ID67723 TaxID=2738134 RepID=UPI0018C39F9D|nr:hypothetical protein [Planomonospora sp. ID67723]MBG0828668.1 hypothetical protein [Planomonospora sp. ID67723]
MPTLIDRIVAEAEFSERHELAIAAPRERVWEAVTTLDLSDLKAARPLFAARDLASRLRNGREQRDMPAASFLPLAADPGHELVQGLLGQWWRLGASRNPTVAGLEEFQAFAEPGYAKAAFNFLLLDGPAGRIRLVTETRVVTTSPDARRAMGRYWRVIRPGSGLIRLIMLRAVRARATR